MGNGRIGAMVFAGAVSDRLTLNEETLWSGAHKKPKRQHSISELYEIRRQVEKKKYYEVVETTADIMLGEFPVAYVPYGTLSIDIVTENSDVTDYRQELDLQKGIVECEYTLVGTRVKKQVFTSFADDALVVNIKTDKTTDIYTSPLYQTIAAARKIMRLRF